MENEKKPGGGRRKLLVVLALVLAAALCVGLHVLSVSGDGRVFPVYLNEILASNTARPNADGLCCDYIELYNSADYPVDLTGFQLGDVAGSGRYAFPYGTILQADSYLVVYCDKDAGDPAYARFGISRSGGEKFYLIGSNHAVLDSVTTVPTDLDQAMIRTGSGWETTLMLTPGGPNDADPSRSQGIYNEEVSPIRLSEFSVTNTVYDRETGLLCDWVELHNPSSQPVDVSGYGLSDNVGNNKYLLPPGTVLAPGGFLVVPCVDGSEDPRLAPFGLSQRGGEQVALKDAGGRIIELVNTLPMDQGAQYLDEQGLWQTTDQPTPGYENSPRGHEAFLLSVGAFPGAVAIREVQAAEQLVLPDAFDTFSDWVELENTTDRPIQLAGWFLTDDPAEPRKWQFPALELAPGERTVLYCSGRDTVEAGQIHTGFSLAAGGETLVLRSWLGPVVDQVTFGPSDWGQSVVFPQGAATDTPTPGYPEDEAGYEAFCAARTPRGPIAIWEVMTANDSWLPQALGKCYDWVELQNISPEPVDLAGFSLTDDPQQPELYTLPRRTLAPGERVVVFLSGDESLSDGQSLHGGFSLNARQDQLLLYGPDGGLLDFAALRQIPRNQSYGRQEGAGGFGYMTPTPMAPNSPGTRQISAMPTGSLDQGVYTVTGPQTLELSAPGTIHYTTDGSEPDAAAAVYRGPITVAETTVVRAVSIEEGKLPSRSYTATLVFDDPKNLPVVSLVTDPDYLWGPGGVYKNGDMTLKEIKFPGHLSYEGPDGRFSLGCEMSLHGATTVTAFEKKSFTVRFQDSFDGPLHFDVFGDGQVVDFASLLVRTAHESTYSTQMHDALIGQVAAEACPTLSSQKYRYISLYLNGEYWGIYAFREHHSPAHYGSYFQVPAESVSMVRFYTDAPNSLQDLYNHCQSGNLLSDEDYAWALSIIDPTSFADWIILESYMSNFDINGNMRYYCSTADGLWRCGLVDLDLGMTGGVSTFGDVARTWHHGIVVEDLLANEQFQDVICSRLAALLAGPLSDQAMLERIDRMAAELRPEAGREEARWGTPVSAWETFVSQMKDHCSGRAVQMIDGLCQATGLSQEKRTAYFGPLES